MTDLNPQAKQMADESMIRTLDAQARAIWPQEKLLVDRYPMPPAPRVLDAGCGTGEGASRFAEHFPKSTVLGVDIIEHHLELARKRFARLAPRLSFEKRSVFGLELPDAQFDLTVCRHVIHSIPHPEQVLAELVRVTKPGGTLHLIPEDYGMLHFSLARLDLQKFWVEVSSRFGAATNTDLFIGRHAFALLDALQLTHITVDYVTVDTLRVPRETLALMFTAWRDGYVESIAEFTSYSAASARAHFDEMIAQVNDPKQYAAWMVPVVSARVPARR